jgi:hypothetical protein
MSPDWSAKEEPVPYARLGDPQTLNLYAYLMNNPLAGVDADGHCSGAGWCDLHGNESATDSEVTHYNETVINQGAAARGQSVVNETAGQPQNAGSGGTPNGSTPYTLTLGTVTVSGTVFRVDWTDGAIGMGITAVTTGCSSSCYWVSTFDRAGTTAGGPTTDRDPGNTSPLYPFAGRHVDFGDKPGIIAGGHGTFSAVTTVGITDTKMHTFKPIGSMTYKFAVDRRRHLSITMPRVASPGEVARSIAALSRQSPGWSIGN